ncbi:MAG: universal stress protein [Desulfobacterales bacterium]
MAPRIIKVLCPTDGSISSEKAIKWAVNTSKNFSNVELTFVLIAGEDVTATDIAYRGAQLIKASQIQEHMELDAACTLAKEGGIENPKCIIERGSGNIAASIIAYAEKEKFDHIVMGSTGRTGVARLLLGSVASEVVAKAHCPVTVVR